MDNYKAELIKEHAELMVKLDKLTSEIVSVNNNDDKVEFANKCIQRAAMRKYAECLEARMGNVGITYNDFEYHEKVVHLEKHNKPIPVEVHEVKVVNNPQPRHRKRYGKK